MLIEIKKIKDVSTTEELTAIAESVLSNYPADDHNYISYSESADLISAQAQDIQAVDHATILYAVEDRWNELENV